MPPAIDSKTHARFLEYKERHVYFGRAHLKQPLTMHEFAALDAERIALEAKPLTELGAAGHKRLSDLSHLLLLD